MRVSRYPVGGRVRATDNEVGGHLLRGTGVTGPVQGVYRGDGGRIIGGEQVDTVWASGRGDTELENL